MVLLLDSSEALLSFTNDAKITEVTEIAEFQR